MRTRHVLKQGWGVALVVGWLAVLMPVLAGPTLSSPAAAADAPGSITLHVESARSVGDGPGFVHAGDPIDRYRWMVNVDDTGDPGTAAQPGTENCLPARAAGGSTDPDFADTCPWPSIRNTSGFAPIVAQGDETDLNGTDALDGLPPGKYLISVTADSFKIDGAHFTITAGTTQRVVVRMNPTPLPLSTIRIQVFQDEVPVDATYEADAEKGLAGFGAHLTDVFGEVSTDYYGNPLCTTYEHVGGDPTAPIVFDADDRPVVDPASTGRCTSDAAGIITIPNLGPNRYAAVVTPPRGQAKDWVQTTTLEGARDHDIWIQEGETGYDNEVLKGGEQVPMVVFGFARPREVPVTANPPTGEVKGVVVAGLPYIGGGPGLSYETGFPNTKVDGPIRRPWVALSDLGAGDAAIYVGRGDKQGAFDIQHVPNGTYQLSVWDDNLDYILWSFNVTVRKGRVSDVGNKMIVGWFTHVHGHVFVDTNENGRRDPGERSVPGFTLTVRERDNSLMDQYTNTKSTNDQGYYDIRETYPLGKWLVLEAFNTRYRTTGISYRGENERKWTTRLGGLVDVDFLPIIGLGGEIDWGVKPYAGASNGGIAGTVSYDTTRNELDPADAASESYQPGIPDLKVHLWASTPCAATTAVEKANTCRQGKAIEPLQLSAPSPTPLLVTAQTTLVDADGDGLADVGETVDETFSVSDTGSGDLTGLSLDVPAADQPTCASDTLAAGGQVACTATHVVTQADVDAGLVRVAVTASAVDSAGTTVTSRMTDSEVAADAASGLTMVKQGALSDLDGDQLVDAGETITWTYSATNTGDVDLTDLAVTDPTAGTVTCPAGTLAAGAHVDCTASYVVTLDDVLHATVSDTARASATLPDATVVTTGESTDTLPADLMVENPSASRGALVKGQEMAAAYTSETWQPPRGCTAYDYKGRVLNDQRALPDFGETADHLCVEAPMMGVAIGPSDKTPGDAGQTVNGNYGFASSDVNQFRPGDPRNPAPDHQMPLYAPLPAGEEQDLLPGDYIISVDLPQNPVGGGTMYQATAEEDVNVFDGDTYLPQENMAAITPAEAAAPPPGDQPTAVQPSQPPSQQAGIVSACAGGLHTVKVTDPAFIDGGGSPFEGQDRPSCDAKLVTVRAGQTAAPNFNLFTDVPIPTHFWGVTLNDLGLTFDKRSVNYGEAQGLPFVPVGLYDYAGQLKDTVHTDFNGLYEALEPSTDTYNCPVPAGPCPNMYRFVGNDPGQPGALNSDYNPRFRTIAASFQGWPGLYTVTDEAPTQVASIALAPDGTTANPTQCDLDSTYPQLFAVDRPVVRMNDASSRDVTVRGTHFGTLAGRLELGTPGTGGTTTWTAVPTTGWTDDTITFTVPGAAPVPSSALGTRTLRITTAGGVSDVNGLTLQLVDGRSTVPNSATNPQVVEVGAGAGQQHTVQAGIEAATRTWATVVVFPNAETATNPRAEYTENVILHSAIRLQGVGPGGFTASGEHVAGSVIDGQGFNPDNQQGTDWLDLLSGLSYAGDPAVPVGAVVTVLARDGNGGGPNGPSPSIDGFTLTGGVQLDFPTNINTIQGGTSTPYGATGSLVTQGGGIYVHSNVRNLQVADNVIVGNSGSYGGGIRIGTPYVDGNRNYNAVVTRNQIRDNGGSNLAGGIGIFAGSDNYAVTDNAVCGNFSAEYGGAATAFGYQAGHNGVTPGGTFRGNRIWFNTSYDEGGGLMVAGELPSRPNLLSEGSGPVTIDRNVISTNISNDDGGGIRLLMTSGSHISRLQPERIRISSNTITDNVSAHEGGGIALDDAVFVDVVGNTVAKNLTTATAVTSDGRAAPAGLSTATNSDPLQRRLRSTQVFANSQTLASTTFSKPTLFDDLFFDNRAGSYNGGRITGLGPMPDGTDGGVDTWDMGMVDVPVGLLTPSYSVLQNSRGTALNASSQVTLSDDPQLRSPFDLMVDVLSSRTYPAFRLALVTAGVLPASLPGDYHLAATTSPAYGRGTASRSVTWGSGFQYTVNAPTTDIDGQTRPSASSPARWDAGSDQLQP